MTKEQIEQMPAGPEMDYLIATQVFKARKPTPEQIDMIKIISLQFGHCNPSNLSWAETILIEPLPRPNSYTGADFCFQQPIQYSTRIEYAWRVIEKIRELRLIHDWENVFVESACWHWYLLSTDAFCLHVCRAALIVTLSLNRKHIL